MTEPETPASGGWRARCLEPIRTGPLLDRLRVFRTCPGLALALAAGNLWAVWWGWTIYYAAHFARTDWYLAPFVSDSPNAVLAFAVALLLAQFGVRWAWLDLLAWVLNIKVGLWTAFVLIWRFDEFFATDPVLRWFLFWLHWGMVAQVFAFHHDLRRARPARWAFALVFGLVALDVALDYWPGLNNHPFVHGGPYDFASVLGMVTIAITAVVFAAAAALYRPRPDGSED